MFIHSLIVRFRDLDALNHVNNSVYLTYLEEARVAYLKARGIDIFTSHEHGMILARCEIDYRFPAELADQLSIELAIGDIRRSSFEFIYKITRTRDGVRIAEARTVQVCYNYRLRVSIRIPDMWREALALDTITI